MENWWFSLNLPLQIFYGTGLIAALFLVIEVLLTFLGMNHHDIDAATDHPDQMGMLSLRTITGFFFGFGWTGVIAMKSGQSLAISIILALVVGMVFLVAIYFLMRALFSLGGSGTLDYNNAVGQIATVYVTVPPSHAGGGQVEVMIQGRLQTISCLTAHHAPLTPNTKVKVIGLVGQGTLEVQPL